MGAQNVTLKKDATSIAVTGGTDLNFTPDGVSVSNGLHLSASSVVDFRVRPSVTLKTRNPVFNGVTFSKGKRWLTITFPQILADGTMAYNLRRIEIEDHPELSASEALNQTYQAAQLLFDSDLASFLSTGSLA
jgi:hypothetical protein